jgi:hypothetical protein
MTALTGKIFVVGIGAQKSGTSWLYHYLAGHPQISMSPIKELHYWDERYRPDLCGFWTDRFAERFQKLTAGARSNKPPLSPGLRDRLTMTDEAAYMRFFENRVPPECRAFGEITPSYALLPVEGLAQLRAQHEQIKVIFLLRDPVSRFWAGFYHNGSPTSDFRTALLDPQHVERTRYDLTLERLDSTFQEGEVLIEFYESLFTEYAIERITTFIGVPRHSAEFHHRVAAHLRPPMPAVYARLAREAFAPVYEYCRHRFGALVPQFWHGGG